MTYLNFKTFLFFFISYMSYVIQNFYNLPRLVVITPKFKYLVMLNSLSILYTFFKLNNYLYTHHNLAGAPVGYLVSLFKVFFIKSSNNFFSKLITKLSSKYPNELTKSAVYWSYFSMNLFLDKRPSVLSDVPCRGVLLFNVYFLAIKVINVKLHKTFYRNTFFYLMLILPSMWYSHHDFTKFHLNFFFIKYNLQVCNFYNGHFLRVYNF